MIRRLIAILSFTFLLGTALAQDQPRGPTLSLAQFHDQLDHLNSQVTALETRPENAEALRKALPDHWTIVGGRQPIDVSAKSLDQALTVFQKQTPENKKVTLRELHTQLTVMQSQLDGFAQSEGTNDAMRKRLDDILAAREFSSVQGPSMWDIWWDSVQTWIRKWWDKLFGKIHITPPDISWLGRIFVWLVIAAGACVLGIWLFRIYNRKQPEFTREIIPFAPSAKSWRVWLDEARAKAERGEWREAIHLSYWAGVSYLEASGLWTPDRARTPREYLRAVDQRDPKKPPFTALTRRFESVWYGSRGAHATDFDAALAELEKLGCQ